MDYLEIYYGILYYLKDFVSDSLAQMNLSILTIILFLVFVAFMVRSIRIFLKSIVIGLVSAVFAFLLNAYGDYGWNGAELVKNMIVFALLGIFIYITYEKILLMYNGTKILYKILKIPIRLFQYIGNFIISTILNIIIRPLNFLINSTKDRPNPRRHKKEKRSEQ